MVSEEKCFAAVKETSTVTRNEDLAQQLDYLSNVHIPLYQNLAFINTKPSPPPSLFRCRYSPLPVKPNRF